jgi:hypothetical protein
VKPHSHTFYITGKHVKKKLKHLRDNFHAELNRMNANKSRDPALSASKRESQWRWYKMLLFFKSTSNAGKMESNLQFQSKQLDRESTDHEKDSCTIIDDDFVAECSSTDNTHQHHRRRLGRLLSEGRGLGVESAHWRKR